MPSSQLAQNEPIPGAKRKLDLEEKANEVSMNDDGKGKEKDKKEEEREPDSEDEMRDDNEVLDLTKRQTTPDIDNSPGTNPPSLPSQIQKRGRASRKKGDSPKKKKGKGGKNKR